MLIDKKYSTTPMYGVITMKEKIRFNDCDIFKHDSWRYVTLKKIKLWWGSPQKKEISKSKTLLGIQCTYKNIFSDELIESKIHCSSLQSSDVIIKEINLKEGDFFNKFYIAFDYDISYIKFETKKGELMELGNINNKDLKTIKLNKEDNNMIQCFIGYYNKNRILALGCKYISKKNFGFIYLLDIFRLKHFFKSNDNERNKWCQKNALNHYNIYFKAIVKLCLLPDNQFYSVIKYYV